MRFSSERKRKYRVRAAMLLAAATVTAVLFVGGVRRVDEASREAVVSEAMCRQVLANTTEGRQALVSSVWWAPLPALVRLPVVAVMGSDSDPSASILVSAFFGMVALFVLNRLLREWRLGAVRFLLLAAVALDPLFAAECGNGSSATLALALVLLTAFGLTQWVAARQVRFLVMFSLSAALLMIASFEMALWLVLMLLLFCVDLVFYRGRRSEKEAVIVLALLPPLYAASLWVLMNWLIMGDALYLVRSVFASGGKRFGLSSGAPVATLVPLASAAMCAVSAVVGAWRRDRGGAYLGIAGAGMWMLALLLAAFGFMWREAPILLALFFLAVMSVAYAFGRKPGEGGAPARAGRALAVVVTAVPLVLMLVALRSGQRLPAPEPVRQATIEAERNRLVPRIQSHVLRRTRYARVYVCGYDSFMLLGSRPPAVFLHALDFNFNKAKDDYPGHRLYLLVRRPDGLSAMDSVHWKYDEIYGLGTRETLYDGDWDAWRLFEIIQAPAL